MICSFTPWNGTSPKDVNDVLTGNKGFVNEKGGYTDADLVVWSKVASCFPDMIAQGVSYAGDYLEIFNYLAKGETLVICEVRMSGYMHFVLAYEAAGDGVWCLDPWDGQVKRLGNFGKVYSAHFYGDATPVVKVVEQPKTEPKVPEKPPVDSTPTPAPVITPEPITEIPVVEVPETPIETPSTETPVTEPKTDDQTPDEEPKVPMSYNIKDVFKAIGEFIVKILPFLAGKGK